jgi:hypothetical protein
MEPNAPNGRTALRGSSLGRFLMGYSSTTAAENAVA